MKEFLVWGMLSLIVIFGVFSTAEAANPTVLIKTSLGDIKVELDAERAPGTVKNFLAYVDSGFYNGTIFHRVISNFMIQGGGFTADMHQKPTNAPIKNEAGNGLSNVRGTIAMARTNIVDSATAQFFINVKDNLFLDHRDETARGFGYAVFGKVIAGMDVVDKIRMVKTGTKGMYNDVPLEAVVINSVERVN
jgi:cyclophilin family peptidyl-prolyl cis-trans isomerase